MSSSIKLETSPHNGLRLVFGTMTFAGQVDEVSAKEQLQTFFEWHPAGSYVELDTAFMYCETKTEQMLGKILTEEQKERLRIATKANPGHKGGLSAESVSTQLNTSLSNMCLDSADIFYLHWPDPKTPLSQTLKRVQAHYKEGKFRELGLSNYKASQVQEIIDICEKNKYVMPTVYQGMYNVLTRDVEPELLPLLRKHNIRFYVYNPLAGGLLSGKYENYEDQPESNTRFDGSSVAGKRYQTRYWQKHYFDALSIIREAMKQHAEGKTMAEVSLIWLHYHSALKRDLLDAIIVGQSNMAHLKTNLNSGTSSFDDKLSPQMVEALDKAWDIVKPHCPTYYR